LGDDRPELPPYIRDYLLERAIDSLPPEVIEVLSSLSEAELEGIKKLGISLEAANADPWMYAFGAH
jgi:hypothetical protein